MIFDKESVLRYLRRTIHTADLGRVTETNGVIRTLTESNGEYRGLMTFVKKQFQITYGERSIQRTKGNQNSCLRTPTETSGH